MAREQIVSLISQVNLVFALVTLTSLPDDLELLQNDTVKNTDKHCVRGLDGEHQIKSVLI